MLNSKNKKIFIKVLMVGCIFTFYSLNSSVFAQVSDTTSSAASEQSQVTQVQTENTTTSQQSVQDNKFLLHLDIGPVFNVKVSSDSLSSTKAAGLSFFVKYTDLDNLCSGLELLFHSRYSGLASDIKSETLSYEAKINTFMVGSSVRLKLNEDFSILGGLDVGLTYAKKYMSDLTKDYLYKVAFGITTDIDYTCGFNPYLHVGAKLNVNLGSISNLQTLVYVGLSF